MQNQKNLIQATADFEHWRQTRINKHASIPDELRCLALKLLEEYPISHVTKALRSAPPSSMTGASNFPLSRPLLILFRYR